MKKILLVQWFMMIALCATIVAGCGADKDARMPKASAAERDDLSGDAREPASAAVPAASVDTAVAVVPAIDTAAAVAGIAAIDTSAELHLSAPVSFEVAARAMGDTIYLKSTDLSDLAGFACSVPEGKSESGEWGPGRYDIDVMRFAHFGKADSPFIFNWVLYMPKDKGKLEMRPIGKGRKTEVTLSGPLHFDIILKSATKPIKMVTKVTPRFTGISSNGSLRGVKLELANGPIGFFREEYLNDTNTKAMVTVIGTSFTFGKRPTSYFTNLPRIVKAAVVDPSGAPWKNGKIGGVRLEWTPTADAVKPVAIAGYNIYRSATPEKPGSWRLVASVPASQRTLQDKSFDGRKRMAYMVTHRSNYPVGFTYEGIGARPAVVEPVL